MSSCSNQPASDCQRASWPALTQALDAALRSGDGTVLLRLSDAYFDRREDGTFASNTIEANLAIGCADQERTGLDVAAMRAQAAQVLEVAPTVGHFFTFGGVGCAQWPGDGADTSVPVTAEGAPPILVVGTTNDPATPYAWSQGLAEQLSSGVLLTWQGEGHTAYGRSNDCVRGAVDAFLLEGTVPAEGTRC